MKYVMNRDDLNGFIEFIGAETEQKGKDIFFRFCPKCGNNAPKDDEWKFSVNWKTGAFGCLRGSCGYHGHFVELCRDFGYKLGMDAEKEYRKMPQPPGRIIPRESAIAYLEGRGINRATAEEYEVTAFKNRPNILWFPFFNEYGKLVFIKYRNMAYRKGTKGSKEWCEEGGQPILFGMKQCKGFDRLVITEGQLDSLSVAEAGISNACSVPTGMNGFTWLPNCLEWIKKFDKVVVFGDLEKGHMSLLDTLKQRLPNRVLAVRKEDYLGEKDANDILRSFGKDAVRRCVENATEPEMSFVKELADVQDVDLNKLPKVKTGIFSLDAALGGGICYGQVCLLTGKRGDGKSTLMSNIFAEALDQGIGCFAYSGELANYHFKRWLNYQLAGNGHMITEKNEFGQDVYTIEPEANKRINDWYRGSAFIFDHEAIADDDREETDSLTDVIKGIASRKNVKLICIDNLMTAMETVTEQNNLYLAQSNFVGALKRIAVRYDVAIILVAHPRKHGRDDSGFDNDSVSGSGDITNKVDIVLNYSRAKKESGYDGELEISKNRLAGTLKMGADSIKLNYSAKTKRVFEVRTLDKRYRWEKSGAGEPVEIDVPF